MLANLSRVMAHYTTVQNFTALRIIHSCTVVYVDYASTHSQVTLVILCGFHILVHITVHYSTQIISSF
jgi:hypothetical protein